MSAAIPARHTRRTSPLHPLLELRSVPEMLALPWSLPLLLRAPRGDGHPVLVLPGFLGGESVLLCHELFLRNRGYDVSHWGLGRNIGFQVKHAKALQQKIRYLHHKTGRKVSLVGWSLGGIFALHGAQQAPECVRQVITLGSPLAMDPVAGRQHLPRIFTVLYRMVAHPMGFAAHFMRPEVKDLLEHRSLQVPLSCLYGLGDGIVPPQHATLARNWTQLENIRVPACHLGMAFNPMVMWIVADRLAQAEGAWQPFAPTGLARRIYQTLTPNAVAL